MISVFTEEQRAALKEAVKPTPHEAAARFQVWKRGIADRKRHWAVALAGLDHDVEEKKRLEDAVGLKVLAAGSERVVFDQGRTVLKIATGGSESTDANLKEHKLWEKAKGVPELSAILVPVVLVAPDGSWLVMEKAKPATTAGEVPEGLPLKLYDVKAANWGRHRGALKLMDYSLWTWVRGKL